jgi:hypothetical protein
MNRTLVLVATLSLALPLAGMAQPTTQTANLSAPMTPREVHSLMLSAHSSAQYQQLAGYFHQQEAKFRAEAAAEKAERDRRAQVNAGLMQKYPRPVDSAQYLYESYVANADSAALQAQHFDQLAAAPTQRNQQDATNTQGKL